MNCTTCQPLLAEYALGLLSDDEGRGVSSHLAAGCPTCARVLMEAQESWVSLVDVLPPAQVPERIEAALGQRIAQYNGRRPSPIESTDGAPFVNRLAAGEFDNGLCAGDIRYVNCAPRRQAFTPEHDEVVPSAGRRLSTIRWVLAASVLVGATIGFAVWFSRENADDPRDQANLRPDEMQQLQLEIDRFSQLFGGNRLHLASLHETDRQSAIRGHVIWDRLSRQIHFYAFDLKPAAAGQVYRIWLVRQGLEPLPVGLLTPQPNGIASVLVDVPAEIAAPFHIGVTEQDLDDALVPKGAPWLTSEVE